MDNNSQFSTLNSQFDQNRKAILIVEDDRRLSYINRHALESEGYETREAYTLHAARSVLAGFSPDVILLDVKLPDGSGFDFCREIRGVSAAHIIFLTSVTEAEGELEGLNAGGNDYLRKPYSIELLLKRVKNAALIKDKSEPPQTITRGSFEFSITSQQASFNGRDMLLAPKEFALLLLFTQNMGKDMSAEDIYKKVWGQTMAGDTRSLRNCVYTLRDKLTAAGCEYTIEKVYGTGYRFESGELRVEN